ncbi:hypothetical protein PC116_g23077 [Phytophthora cactorum]|uniref:Uncharacterized protein n=1 Tax=Phytophthora cactorum TaxID=29920 RepID=A0A8T1K385_9STRA|nr:hypothetical protein PC113_g18993 [Phytophthora cactorum]KAG2883117.1 hypothetical protein PC114_g20726 [Phytophthora cactorum]KAG2906388.1 hypothetical protein PC117_g20535 [Phytophthora cactorum]KAG2984738.1 hypothetical protein PC119_g20321 [Phytophthora cactorum]KAG3002511.1 hypothetical protein PC120_g19692 [Phytophthora cactorum]
MRPALANADHNRVECLAGAAQICQEPTFIAQGVPQGCLPSCRPEGVATQGWFGVETTIADADNNHDSGGRGTDNDLLGSS